MKEKLNLQYILQNHGVHSFTIEYDKKSGKRKWEQLFLYSIKDLKKYIQTHNINRKNTYIGLNWIHYDGNGADDFYSLNRKETFEIFK